MAYVNFGRTLKREDALKSTNKDKIYFPTDAATIIMGGKEYGGDKESLQADINTAKEEALNTVSEHTSNTANPHKVTKTQIGLGNVTNEAQIPLSAKGQANGVAELDANGKVKEEQLNTIYQTLKAKEFASSNGGNVAGQQINLSADGGVVVGEKYKNEATETTTKAYTTITKEGVTVESAVTSSIDDSANYSSTAKLLPTGVEVGSTTLSDGILQMGADIYADAEGIQVGGGYNHAFVASGSISVLRTTFDGGMRPKKSTETTITPTSITIGGTTIDEDKLKRLLSLIG